MYQKMLGTLSLLFSFALAISFGADQKKPKAAATPEDAVRQLADAVNVEDYHGVHAMFAKEPRESEEAMRVAAADLVKAVWALHDAMDKTFGKDPKEGPRPDFKKAADEADKAAAGAFRNATVMSTKSRADGSVELKTRFTPLWRGKEEPREDILIAVREDGGWKLIPARYNAQEEKGLTEFLRKRQAGYEEVAKRVREGKYLTRDEAVQAQAEAELAAAQGMLKKYRDKAKKP